MLNLLFTRLTACLLAALLVLAGVFAQVAPSWADPLASDLIPPSVESPSRLSLDASTIPSEKVSQFVKAYLQVLGLIERRETELQAAETPLESKRLEGEIQAEAFAIIESAGLTRQEYLQLLNLANIDPEFGERVAAQMQQ